MSCYREQLAAVLAVVQISAPTQYAWFGRRSRRLSTSLDAALDDAQRRSYLVACLREELYASFYCHGGPVAARWGEPVPLGPDPQLVDAMSAANAGRGSWDAGWTVELVEADQLVVSARGLRVRVPIAQCSGRAAPGAAVSVRLPKELPAFSPGFWTVLGDTAAPPASQAGDVRVYWNVTAASAPALVRALTTRLNREAVPFRLKVADHPFGLERCDAAVLYLDGDDFRRHRLVLDELVPALAGHLRPEIPAFTFRRAPGVGLAEGDAARSFGVQRSALLADAIVRAHERGLTRIDDRVEAAVDRFREDGIAIEAPYLEPSLAGRHVL